MSRVREIVRLARRVPGVRKLIESGDDGRRAALLVASGLVDAELYARLLGVEQISAEDAALHYAREGHAQGLTINVLLDPDVIGNRMMRSWRPVLYDYLNSRAWFAHASGLWDAFAYQETEPDATSHPGGPAGHLWEHLQRTPDATIVVTAGGIRTLPWADVYEAASSALVAHAAAARAKRERLPHADRDDDSRAATPARTSGPLVSIVMPVLNRSGAMRTAVDSVTAQAWQNWELLIVDDGSWDDSVRVAETIAARDPRVRVLTPGHQGVSGARNSALAEAQGEYVAFLDSDNTWEPEFLSALVTALEDSGAESGYATIALESESGRRYRDRPTDFSALLQGNSIDLNTFVVRRDVVAEVGGFDTDLVRAVDYDLILRVARRSRPLHVDVIGAIYDDREDSTDRISNSEALGWNTRVRLTHDARTAAVTPTTAGSEVLWLVQTGDPRLTAKLEQAATLAEAGTVVRIVLVGGLPGEHARTAVAGVSRDAVSMQAFDADEPYSYVVTVAAATVGRETFVVIDPRADVAAETVAALAEATAPGVATMPLSIAPDGTLRSVGSGVSRPGAIPHLLLSEHPEADAPPAAHSVPLLSGRSFAIATADFRRVDGLDPLLFNEFDLEALSLRLATVGTSRQVLPAARFWHPHTAAAFRRHDAQGDARTIRAATLSERVSNGDDVYAAAGLRIDSYDEPAQDDFSTAAPRPVVIAGRLRDSHASGENEPPRLRWAIKIAAPAGPRGETWGDVAFAHALARALRALGQDAVVDPRESVERSTRYLDDVDLVLRGLDTYQRRSSAPALLWVISHPDDVSRGEAKAYDHVFAASVAWSRRMSERWGVPITPLLQCTDPERFRPSGFEGDRGPLLFVGNSRWVARPSVTVPVQEGVALDIYGGDWEPFIAEELVTASHVDNSQVAPLYERAGAVLNDHWNDMRREGFISNRLFDVVAAGGRAISDDVEGITEIFAGSVYTYADNDELREAVTSDLDTLFPAQADLDRLSERIRTEHSFLARARDLVAVAQSLS